MYQQVACGLNLVLSTRLCKANVRALEGFGSFPKLPNFQKLLAMT
jgi:hypothetical protein